MSGDTEENLKNPMGLQD